MLHPNRILSWALILFASISAHAQYGDLGIDNLPNDHDLVDDLIYYGGLLEFEGGYHVGDTAANFTIYDFDGNSVNFYEELEGEKPVMLMSGSVSCLRFRNSFPNQNEQASQAYLAADIFFDNYAEQFNLLFVYGIEAHPTDGNCPSNCPPTTSNDTTVVQAPDYLYRKWAMKTWTDSPDFHFPFNMYCDNPDNAVYNTFFQRPYGALVFNCDATVAYRGNWGNEFFQQYTDALLQFADNYDTCSIDWVPEEETDEEEEIEGEDNGEGTEEEEENDEGTDEEDDDEGTNEEEENGEGTDEEDGTDEEEDEEEEDVIINVPLDDLESDGDEEIVSVNDFEVTNNWGFYPNPANQVLTIQVDIPSNYTVYGVIDITGKTVLNGQLTQTTTRIDVSQFATGLYFIEIVNQNGIASRERLIIR